MQSFDLYFTHFVSNTYESSNANILAYFIYIPIKCYLFKQTHILILKYVKYKTYNFCVSLW